MLLCFLCFAQRVSKFFFSTEKEKEKEREVCVVVVIIMENNNSHVYIYIYIARKGCQLLSTVSVCVNYGVFSSVGLSVSLRIRFFHCFDIRALRHWQLS